MESDQDQALRDGCFKALKDWTPFCGVNSVTQDSSHYDLTEKFRIGSIRKDYADAVRFGLEMLECTYTIEADQGLLRKYLLAFLAELWQIDYDGD